MFLREKSLRQIATYGSASILVFSFVIVIIIKMLVAYLDVMLLLLSQTSTFDSQNSLYLKIFWFIQYNFMFFRDKDSFSIP